MNVITYAFYRHAKSEYEQPEAGAGRANYFRGYIRAIVRAHHSVFPDWAMWFYHDNRVTDFPEWALLKRYEEAGLVKLFPCGEAKTLTGSMLWRLKPGFEPDVQRFLCRDVDSLPQPRERTAVMRWVASGRPISALHDSTSHRGTIILGGMCGFKAEYVRARFKDWAAVETAMAESGIDFDRKGGDQHFLNMVFPDASAILSENVAEELWDRDRNFCEGYARCVGGGFNAEGVRKWYDRQGLTDPRILACEG